MPAALATATAGAGVPRSSPAVLPGPATSTSSAFAAGAIVTTSGHPPSGLGAGPLGTAPLGGVGGLSHGLATALPGSPTSFLTLAQATATATAAPGQPTSVARYGVAAARAIAARGTPLDVTVLLDQAAAEADRVPTFGLRADWNGDGSYDHPLSELTPVVTEFTVEREIASELPDDIGIVQGTAATKMTATLAGTWYPDGATPPSEYVLGPYTLMPTGVESEYGPTSFTTANFVFGLEWSATKPVQIDALRYWRAATSVSAAEGALFDVDTRIEVPGTRVTFTSAPAAPAWHAASLSAPFFPEVGRRYKVAIRFTAFGERFNYFSNDGPGAKTVDFGPLRRYSAAEAFDGAQGTWLGSTTLVYPTGANDGQSYGVDLVATTRVPLAGNPNARDTDPVKAFAPYRTDADLAGLPIIGRRLSLTTGMQTSQGSITQQRFTGTVSAFAPSSAARQVVLEGLDPVDHLRSSISQAAWGISGMRRLRYGEKAYPARMNSQWYIDRILRANGYFASPPPGVPLDDSRLLLSATMHGSPLAEVAATTDYPRENYGAITPPDPLPLPWKVGDHPFGMLAPNPASIPMTGGWDLGFPLSMGSGNGYALPIWIRVPGAGDDLPLDADMININPIADYPLAGMMVCFRSGKPSIRLQLPDGSFWVHTPTGYTLPAQAEWQFFGCWWNFTATGGAMSMYSATLGTRTGFLMSFTPLTTGFTYNPSCPVGYASYTPFSNVSLYRQTAEPTTGDWTGATWIKTARVDVGANDWGGILEQNGAESYALIKEIVAAEFGQFGFDEDGIPHFRSRAVRRDPTRIETVTSERSLTDLTTKVDESTVRNYIDLSVQQYELQPWETIFEAEDVNQFIIPPAPSGGSVTVTWDLPLPPNCAQVWQGFDFDADVWYTGALLLSSDDWSEASSNPWFAPILTISASYVETPTVLVEPASMLQFGLRKIDRRTMRLFVTNTNTVGSIRLATPDQVSGSPTSYNISPGVAALRIPGRIVKPNNPATGSITYFDSVARYGKRAYDLGGESVWRQRLDSAFPLSEAVLDWTGFPRPVLAEIDVPHNPRRKLYDQVTVTDAEGLGSVTGKLAGITTRYSADDGARDQLLVRPNDPPAGW